MILNTLRFRLILSHVIPLLVIIPVVGIALVYVLETQVLLINLSKELESQALLVTEIANDHVAVWDDPALAQSFVARTGPNLTGHVMLLTPDGHLLASSDPADARRVGRVYESLNRADILDGDVSVRTIYCNQLEAEVAQVLVPVIGPGRQMMGVVRLSRRLTTVRDWFLRLRHLIAEVLFAGLILGTITGGVLAINMERPLRQVTEAIYQLAAGKRTTPLSEQGPREIRQLLRAFNDLMERLKTMERARRQLLANLVHELGRPLGALYAATEALRAGATQDPSLCQRLLDGMKKGIEGLQRLLSDLSELHNQVLGALELRLCTVDLGAWLPKMLSPWQEAAQRQHLYWETTTPAELPTVEADPDRLAQALGNLLDNAIKYTPPGGMISVVAGNQDEQVWIQVRDTGPGISLEEQEHLFTPLYRGKASGRFPQGMGLGLAIAHNLIIAHNGRLEVESVEGRGSRFTIWLPIFQSNEQGCRLD
jgi:signal transduction histidine kinase